jgi:hypothetical protein
MDLTSKKMEDLKVIDYTMSVIDTFNKAVEYHGNADFEFRVIISNKSGMTVHDFRDFENVAFSKDPSQILGYFKKGVLQTIQAKHKNTDTYVTLFKRKGKKITLVDKAILYNLKVGTINSCWYNTQLYNWQQYKAVNSKTWDSYAYRMNEYKTSEACAA